MDKYNGFLVWLDTVGTEPGVIPALPAPPIPSQQPQQYLPWWPEATQGAEAYHSRSRSASNHEALLADSGAWDNRAGDGWDDRTLQISRKNRRNPSHRPMARTMNVQGVGKHDQSATQYTYIPGQLERGSQVSYTAPVMPGSFIPAPFGLRSIRRKLGNTG